MDGPLATEWAALCFVVVVYYNNYHVLCSSCGSKRVSIIAAGAGVHLGGVCGGRGLPADVTLCQGHARKAAPAGGGGKRDGMAAVGRRHASLREGTPSTHTIAGPRHVYLS